MVKVFVTRKLPVNYLTRIKEAGIICENYENDSAIPHELFIQRVVGCHGILCLGSDKISESVIKSAGSTLKVVSIMSVIYDNVDIKLLKSLNIKLCYTPDVTSDATAELTVALLLTTSRFIPAGISALKNGSCSSWKLFWLCGQGLNGSCVGIVGMGNIGEAVARRLVPFSIKRLLYFTRCGKAGDTKNLNGFTAHWSAWQELLSQSDFVIVCSQLDDSTRKPFNTQAFSMMKPNAVFVNVSHGNMVDQEALLDALANGKIYSAGLDVTDPEPLDPNHPLLKLPNCVVLPHIGSATMETRRAMIDLGVDNLIAGVLNKPLKMEA